MKKPFDLEKLYDNEIFPLMAKIIEICKEHNLPFVATFQYNSDNDVCSSAYLPEERPIAGPLNEIYSILQPRRSPALTITTRDKDGSVTRMETIL